MLIIEICQLSSEIISTFIKSKKISKNENFG